MYTHCPARFQAWYIKGHQIASEKVDETSGTSGAAIFQKGSCTHGWTQGPQGMHTIQGPQGKIKHVYVFDFIFWYLDMCVCVCYIAHRCIKADIYHISPTHPRVIKCPAGAFDDPEAPNIEEDHDDTHYHPPPPTPPQGEDTSPPTPPAHILPTTPPLPQGEQTIEQELLTKHTSKL